MAGGGAPPPRTLLVWVCDVEPMSWATARAGLTLPEVMRAVAFCFHAHLRLNATNTFALVACDRRRAEVLVPPPGGPLNTGLIHFDELHQNVLIRLSAFIAAAEETGDSKSPGTSLAAGLSLAMCLAHRATHHPSFEEPVAAHILVVSASPDTPTQYVSTMNALFSACKLDAPIDSCHLGKAQSAFLQQAAELTGGVYLRPQDSVTLLQSLLSTVLCPKALRSQLPFPFLSLLDAKAACFCHKRDVDVGHVCSVCFSVFCTPLDQCPTCGVAYRTMKSEPTDA
jgi:transcription initiation factor TFIIH subunit 3